MTPQEIEAVRVSPNIRKWLEMMRDSLAEAELYGFADECRRRLAMLEKETTEERSDSPRASGALMQITPAERIKIDQLVFRLGLKKVPSDTNIMAWVLPVLEATVERFEQSERRIRELEVLIKENAR
jgi:hypothetical protein